MIRPLLFIEHFVHALLVVTSTRSQLIATFFLVDLAISPSLPLRYNPWCTGIIPSNRSVAFPRLPKPMPPGRLFLVTADVKLSASNPMKI
jgi:hypothetical protein